MYGQASLANQIAGIDPKDYDYTCANLETHLDTIQTAMQSIVSQAQKVLDGLADARTKEDLDEIWIALSPVFNIGQTPGYSGPIGSQYEKALVASALAFPLANEIVRTNPIFIARQAAKV